MSNKISYEEFIQRLKEKTDTIIPISEYIGWGKPMIYRCLVCGNEWQVSEASSFYYGYGCPECAKEIRSNKIRISSRKRAKSENEFRKELLEIHPNLIPNDTYINAHTKYHCICKIHGCDVYKTPAKYISAKRGCTQCALEKIGRSVLKYTDEEFKNKALLYNPNLIFLDDFKNVHTKITVQCKICGYIWKPAGITLIDDRHYGCPKCANNAILTPDEFRSRLEITHPYLELLSDYVRANKKVHVKCNNCGKDYWITPAKLQQGRECPKCHISKGERLIRNYLDKNEIEYVYEKKYDGLIGLGGGLLSYDFYLPQYNLLIEMQGIQHIQPVDFTYSHNDKLAEENFKKQQEHDKRKREYAESHNIPLLEIWYDEIDHIDTILDNYLQIKKVS